MITDGNWTLVDYDWHSGRSVWGYFDGAQQHYRMTYPVESTISRNRAIADQASKAWAGDYHLIASVPLNILYDENGGLNKAHLEGDDKYVSRFLNDSDNRAWRVKQGRV